MRDGLKTDTNRSTVFFQRRGLALGLWGTVGICLIKGWLFQWTHPDVFWMSLAGVMAALGSVLLWFPPKLTMTPTSFSGASFGVLWFTVPWCDIDAMVEFRSQWGRSLGLRVRPGLRPEKGVRKFSSAETGYDILVTSRWDAPLDTVAQTAAAYWKAQGGSGVVADRITHPDLAQFVTDTPER